MGLRANMAMWAGNRAARRTAPAVAARGAHHFVDKAIDGFTGFPGAREVARRHLERRRDVDHAIRDVIEQHVRLAGVQGFVTNVGGVVTMPVAIPANIAGIAVLHLRMAAAIAHLRGYDVTDPKVRAAALMTLLGKDGERAMPSSPHDVAVGRAELAPDALERVTTRVAQELAGRIGGKHATLMFAKRVPVLGGAVSAGVDAVSTWSVGRYARAVPQPRDGRARIAARLPTVPAGNSVGKATARCLLCGRVRQCRIAATCPDQRAGRRSCRATAVAGRRRCDLACAHARRHPGVVSAED